jgi:hypothetical protein
MRAQEMLVSLLALAGCGSTGQQAVTVPLFAAGVAPAPVTAGEWSVNLEVARVGLGPIYFCATEGASMDLCPAAVSEFAAVAVVDGLDATPRRLGDVTGVSGAIRSATYDFAVSWRARQSEPTPAAVAPDGHSAHFEGSASRGATTLRFACDVDVLPQHAGTRAVQGARAAVDLRDGRARLDVTIDPRAWFAAVDFDELLALGGDPVVVPPSSRAANALVIHMTTTGQPVFTWSTP